MDNEVRPEVNNHKDNNAKKSFSQFKHVYYETNQLINKQIELHEEVDQKFTDMRTGDSLANSQMVKKEPENPAVDIIISPKINRKEHTPLIKSTKTLNQQERSQLLESLKLMKAKQMTLEELKEELQCDETEENPKDEHIQ